MKTRKQERKSEQTLGSKHSVRKLFSKVSAAASVTDSSTFHLSSINIDLCTGNTLHSGCWECLWWRMALVQVREVQGGGGHADESSPLQRRRRRTRKEEEEEGRLLSLRDRSKHQTQSARGVAAQKRVEHGQLHTLLVPATPRHHCALAVGGVEVVTVAGVRQADDGFARLGEGDLSHGF